MSPPAPARFSTTTCWWMLSESVFATMRATVSVPPPGSKPTTMVTVLEGKPCAAATPASAMPATSAMNRFINPPRVITTFVLFAFEDRLALLHEGLAPLGVILAVEAFLHPRAACGRVVIVLHHLVDHPLRGANGERRVRRDHVAVLACHVLQLG